MLEEPGYVRPQYRLWPSRKTFPHPPRSDSRLLYVNHIERHGVEKEDEDEDEEIRERAERLASAWERYTAIQKKEKQPVAE